MEATVSLNRFDWLSQKYELFARKRVFEKKKPRNAFFMIFVKLFDLIYENNVKWVNKYWKKILNKNWGNGTTFLIH